MRAHTHHIGKERSNSGEKSNKKKETENMHMLCGDVVFISKTATNNLAT
jgi:hypothetical protein